ncbi:AAA family ATPase [Streptomyces sp. NPDC006296]|uniref:nSTAND1 domain-containing NTPase n=1 Tax=Streptomyces sp. NPDC006296 TaxID=3156746 RepID=UPI0033B2E3AB
MPRKERPLAEGDGSVLRFAAELRGLRDRAGTPTYRQLASRAHYSVATLSSAAAGHRLPSLEVTLAYVRACGGDPGPWEARWREAAAEAARTGPGPGDEAGPDPSGPAPYTGLAAYRPEQSTWFFGRESVVEDLVGRVRDGRFVAVFGASGAGKSSVLRAGLLARLQDGGAHTVLVTPGSSPMEELAVQLARPARTTPGRLYQELVDAPENLHRTLRRIACDAGDEADVFLVVDQFEELFTLCTAPEERALFVAALVHAVRADSSRSRIVLSVRSDFHAHCAEYPDLADLLSGSLITLGAMRPGELHRAITQPAVRSGCRVEGRLLTHLIAQAQGQAGMLPLLSHALLETWKRRRGNVLTLAGFQAAGSIEGALRQTAEEYYDSLDTGRQAAARRLFLRLTALGEGTEDTRRRIDRTEAYSGGEDAAVVERAAAARLITLDTDTVELTHEALIQSWPRLRRWLHEDREQLRVHRELTLAAETWDRLHHDSGALYRGVRLEAARPLARDEDAGLTAGEKNFLRASLAQEAAEASAATRRRLLGRFVTAAIAALLLVATGTTVLAARANREVLAQRNHAIALNLGAAAAGTSPRSPGLAVQLALVGYRLSPGAAGHDILLSTLMTAWRAHDEEMYALDVTPDGRTAVTGGRDRTVRLWDLTTPGGPTRTAVLTGHRDAVYAVAVRPDGTVMATAGADRTVRLWDISDPHRPTVLSTLRAHTGAVRALAFSPSGTELASGGNDRTTVLWDTHDPVRPVRRDTLRGHTDGVRSVAFDRNGRFLATAGGDDERVILWDASSPGHANRLAVWRAHAGHTISVAFSPRTDVLATSGDGDHPVRLWQLTGDGPPRPGASLDGQTDVVGSVAFSADGRYLAAGSDDRTSRLWDVSTPARPALRTVLTGYPTAVLSVHFAGSGHALVTGVFDGTMRLLPADTARLVDRACDRAGPPLTRSQWDRHLSGIAYEPPCP